MNFMTAKEAAVKWGLSIRRVQILCEHGRIVGSEKLGKIWVIPKDSMKPTDGRYKTKNK